MSQHVETYHVRGASGTTYQVELQFIRDDQPGDTIRVIRQARHVTSIEAD